MQTFVSEESWFQPEGVKVGCPVRYPRWMSWEVIHCGRKQELKSADHFHELDAKLFVDSLQWGSIVD
jgi:hypothetical protein